jgi:hypothetical protein
VAAVCIFALGTASLAARQLISTSDEIALGRQLQRQVQAKTPGVNDRAVAAYVEAVGRRLTAHAGGTTYPFSFRSRIIVRSTRLRCQADLSGSTAVFLPQRRTRPSLPVCSPTKSRTFPSVMPPAN